MKRSDIEDDLVVQLAAEWRSNPTRPGVVAALIERGVPAKLALAKVEHLVDRGLLEYGVSPNFAWPTSEPGTCPRGPFCVREAEWGHPCDRGENWDRNEACERVPEAVAVPDLRSIMKPFQRWAEGIRRAFLHDDALTAEELEARRDGRFRRRIGAERTKGLDFVRREAVRVRRELGLPDRPEGRL